MIIGHEEQRRLILTSVNRDSSCHAYLFYGKEGIGKSLVANLLAKTLNCPQKTMEGECCNVCQTCREIGRGAYPDVLLIEHTKHVIKIEAIREVVKSLKLAPLLGRVRVVVIDGAEYMNLSAANGLLKSLEEPPPKTVFILLSHNYQRVLPTIRSRCIAVGFKPLTIQQIRDIVKANHEGELPEEQLLQAAQIGHGSASNAINALNETYLASRGQAFDLVHQSLTGNLTKEFFLLLDSYVKKVPIDQSLEWLQVLFRDALVLKYTGNFQKCMLSKWQDLVKRLSTLEHSELFEIIATLESHQQNMLFHPNHMLFWEGIVFKLGVYHGVDYSRSC